MCSTYVCIGLLLVIILILCRGRREGFGGMNRVQMVPEDDCKLFCKQRFGKKTEAGDASAERLSACLVKCEMNPRMGTGRRI